MNRRTSIQKAGLTLEVYKILPSAKNINNARNAFEKAIVEIDSEIRNHESEITGLKETKKRLQASFLAVRKKSLKK